MSDAPRRPILKLKFPPAPPPAPEPTPAEAVGTRWKCKPCGAVVVITGQEPAEDEVRCPACNARLGLAGDFQRSDGDGKVRARRA
jgi:DNA-directed RNA polymerase subunit RPC12/RpoP